MKKHVFSRRIAGALAVAMVATGALSLLTPPLKSDNLGLNRLFSNNSDFSMVAEAATKNINLTEADLTTSGDAITGFTPSGAAVLADALENTDLNDRIILTFPNDVYPAATKIAENAFEYKLNRLGSDGLAVTSCAIELHLSDNIVTIEKEAFINNENIVSVVFGSKTNEIAEKAFANNKILTSVVFNEGLKILGDEVFVYSNLSGELKLPDSLEELGKYCLAKNKITSVKLPDNIKKIDNGAFSENEITYFDFGAYTNVLGRRVWDEAFVPNIIPMNMLRMNKLQSITIPNTVTEIGSRAFELNDLREVNIPSSITHIFFQAFHANENLKNVKFEYTNPGATLRKLDDQTFNWSSLASINVPSYFEIYKETYDYGEVAFEENKGWTDGTRKVAIYRVGADGTTYVTDNSLTERDFFEYNPVLVEFSLKDKDGADISALKPQNIDITRTNVANLAPVATVNPIDYEHYKLGDKLTFKLGAALPENYQLAVLVKNPDGTVASETALTPDPTGKYEVTLDPNNNQIVEEVSYGDGYEVGYKKTTFTLKYTGSSSSGEPVVPYEPSTPSTPEQPASPSTPAQPATPANNTDNGNTPQINNNVDINDQNTPQGDTDIDDDSTPQGNTVIDDDTTPQGKAKTGTKVKADKSDKVNIEDTKSPLGQLPRTGGSNDSYLVLLGGALIGLGIVVKRKLR